MNHKMLEKLLDSLVSGEKKEPKKRVVKTVAMRAEWTKAWERLNKVSDEEVLAPLDRIKDGLVKADGLKRLLWSLIENDLENFGQPMRINTDTNEVELLEEVKDEDDDE